MKSTQTEWTKTGITARDITTRVSGPSSLKADITVPKGTGVRFIGHWVVAELGWLASKVGADLIESMPSMGADRGAISVGRNSIVYHDADHYGIPINEADVTDIKDASIDAVRRRPRP